NFFGWTHADELIVAQSHVTRQLFELRTEKSFVGDHQVGVGIAIEHALEGAEDAWMVVQRLEQPVGEQPRAEYLATSIADDAEIDAVRNTAGRHAILSENVDDVLDGPDDGIRHADGRKRRAPGGQMLAETAVGVEQDEFPAIRFADEQRRQRRDRIRGDAG